MYFFCNPTIVTHGQLSLPKRVIWGPLCPLDVLNILVGREKGQTSREVQDLKDTKADSCWMQPIPWHIPEAGVTAEPGE